MNWKQVLKLGGVFRVAWLAVVSVSTAFFTFGMLELLVVSTSAAVFDAARWNSPVVLIEIPHPGVS